MLPIVAVLVLLALILTILVAAKYDIPLWVPVLLLCLVELLRVVPFKGAA